MNGACGERRTQCLQVGKTVLSIDERSGLKNYSDVRFATGVYVVVQFYPWFNFYFIFF